MKCRFLAVAMFAALIPSAMAQEEVDVFALPLVLNGINDRGPNLDAHAFELYGNFPSAQFVHPIVNCAGKLMQAEVMAPPLQGQINVNVEAMPSATSCTFQLERLTDNAKSGILTLVTSTITVHFPIAESDCSHEFSATVNTYHLASNTCLEARSMSRCR
jgi:hypothetical protein